ncbi:MAG: efflux RND transporter periplasmic adaptor subunit [Chitinophagaceae bacterium]
MKLEHRNILYALAASLMLASCGSKSIKQQSGPPAVPVTTTEVTTANAIYYDQYPATTIALDEIKLTSQVTGYITGIYFKDGQNVKKGQLLYSIDAQIYKANYNQAVADLQVQQANLVKAQKDANRYNELEKHDAIAKQQVDYANAALEVSEKQVAAAKANVASLHSNVQFANIHAPLTGTIGISQVKKGTSVVAGQTILNTVSTDNPIAVDFTIDQKDIYRFIKLQESKDNIKDSIFTIAFGEDIYPNPGNISFIDRAVDALTGTIKVRLIFANEKGILKPGMNTTVRVRNSSAVDATMIPYKAVSELLGEFFVYVVGDSSKVSEQQVVLGRQIGSEVIVQKGLKPGEKIVVEGVQNLHEGSVIKTAN